MSEQKLVCLFVEIEFARSIVEAEIELVRDELQFAKTLEEVKRAHHRLTNVMKCMQDIEARETRED